MLFRFLLVLMGLCSALRQVQVTNDAGAVNESQKWGWLQEQFHPHAGLGFARCFCKNEDGSWVQREFFGGYDRMEQCRKACVGYPCYCKKDDVSFWSKSYYGYGQDD